MAKPKSLDPRIAALRPIVKRPGEALSRRFSAARLARLDQLTAQPEPEAPPRRRRRNRAADWDQTPRRRGRAPIWRRIRIGSPEDIAATQAVSTQPDNFGAGASAEPASGPAAPPGVDLPLDPSEALQQPPLQPELPMPRGTHPLFVNPIIDAVDDSPAPHGGIHDSVLRRSMERGPYSYDTFSDYRRRL